MKIQILGTGCGKCRILAERAEVTARELGIEFELEKVESITEILALGVMLTPAMLLDGKVKVMGRVPSLEEMRWILHDEE